MHLYFELKNRGKHSGQKSLTMSQYRLIFVHTERKKMKRRTLVQHSLPVSFDMGTRGAVSTILQKRIDDSLNARPLNKGESRGLQGYPGHFITRLSRHNLRTHECSTKGPDGRVVYVHAVPTV